MDGSIEASAQAIFGVADVTGAAPGRLVTRAGSKEDFGHENRWRLSLRLHHLRGQADPERTTICHCTDCQRLSGSAFRVVVRVPGDTFKITAGEPTIYVKTAESGARRVQGFCPRCGTPIYSTAEGDELKFFSVRVGTVRQRAALVPQVQIWSRSQLRWVTDVASIRRLEKQ